MTCPTCTHGRGFHCPQCWPKGHTLTVAYYDGPPVVSDYPDAADAYAAWDDMLWAAVHAPKDQCGDVRAVTLRQGDKVLMTRSW